jgi:hypothetical protein
MFDERGCHVRKHGLAMARRAVEFTARIMMTHRLALKIRVIRLGRRVMYRSIMILEPLRQLLDVFWRPVRDFHAQMQPHPGEHFFYFIQ